MEQNNSSSQKSEEIELVFDKFHPWLAPLAGYSDLAMRLLARKYGAKICVTEMVSAKGIVYGGKNTTSLLKTTPEDQNTIVQLFGNEAHFLVEAMAAIQDMGFKYFDINMGCSVKKVTKTGAGAAMLREVENMLVCAEAMLKQSNGKTGFKFRLGYHMNEDVWKEFVPALCEMGAMYLVLHPRYAKQHFQGTAKKEILSELKAISTVPVIASGDLLTAQDGKDCIDNYNVDSLMFARGAISNPAIFEDYLALVNNESPKEHTLDRAFQIVQDYVSLCIEHFPDRALPRMRAFVPRILHNFHSVSHLRKAIIAAQNWEEFNLALNTYYKNYTGNDYEPS